LIKNMTFMPQIGGRPTDVLISLQLNREILENEEVSFLIWGAQQLRTGCLSILMFLAPLAEVTP